MNRDNERRFNHKEEEKVREVLDIILGMAVPETISGGEVDKLTMLDDFLLEWKNIYGDDFVKEIVEEVEEKLIETKDNIEGDELKEIIDILTNYKK